MSNPFEKAHLKGKRVPHRIVLLAYGAERHVWGALALGSLLAFPVVAVLTKVTARHRDYSDHKWRRLLWRVTRRVRCRGQATQEA